MVEEEQRSPSHTSLFGLPFGIYEVIRVCVVTTFRAHWSILTRFIHSVEHAMSYPNQGPPNSMKPIPPLNHVWSLISKSMKRKSSPLGKSVYQYDYVSTSFSSYSGASTSETLLFGTECMAIHSTCT